MIKRNKKNNQAKFKVRCQRFLYTLAVKDSEKAEKLKSSLPPSTSPTTTGAIYERPPPPADLTGPACPGTTKLTETHRPASHRDLQALRQVEGVREMSLSEE